MNLFEEIMLNPLAFFYKGKYPFTDKVNNLTTIKGFLVEKTFNAAENRFEYTSIQRFDYKPCKDYKNKLLYKEFFDASISGTIHKYILCPDIESLPQLGEVTTTPTGLSSKTIYVRFYPCSLPDRSHCEPGFLPNSAGASILVGSLTPDSTNYSEPLQFGSHSYLAYFTPEVKRIFTYNIKRHRIVDVLNEYQRERLREEYLVSKQSKVDELTRDSSHTYCSDSEMTFFTKTCDDFLTMHYTPSSEVITLRRNYKKLSELFGEFGGIMKIASVLFIFYVVYNSRAKEKMLAREVFGYKKEKTSRVTPKRETNNLTGKKVQEKKNPNENPQSPQEIAINTVRDTLNVTNFIQKMNVMKLLCNIMIDHQNERILSLVNLKQLILLKRKNLGEKFHLQDKISSGRELSERGIRMEDDLWNLVDGSGIQQHQVKVNQKNLILQKSESKAKNSTARWIFVDEDEDQNEQKNNQNRGKKLILESGQVNQLEKDTEKKALWTITENEQTNMMIPRRGSPESVSSPKRRFKRGITPFSIRVRQKGSKSSLEERSHKNLQ